MGKKGRKTRWRTLTITDERSDSEESNTTTSGHRVSKGYHPQKSYYGRFTYSSQSTPTRRYQCEGTKSTRSSSTASENKITFNEDEYTRITTPRQDVLFKKGYLNKPKTYQTQTSTGNSTTSTGNSTGNGTPDHQSTDLEYESQFVFPNGFVDQNGIYYVNSFEPYPVMVFNPPTYYPDFTSIKSKRCSTGSLTESTSPNNEETSQDLSQSETPNNVSDFNRVYNVIYPGFYFNGACQPQDVANHNQPEPRRMKKKRRRKLSRSKSVQEATTSEYTDESSDEVFSKGEERTSEEEKKDVDEPLANGLSKEESEEEEEEEKEVVEKPKYDLKPDAEEFVPRAYRQPESIPMEPNVQFIKIPSNFVPLPILNHHPLAAEFNGQNFNAFIPPGIPINFIPQNYVNYIPNSYVNKTENSEEGKKQTVEEAKSEEKKTEEKAKETVEVPKSTNQIDIAKIVSKLEEAAKEQDNEEKCKGEEATNDKTKKVNNPGKNFKRTRCQKVDAKPPEDEKPEPVKTAWKPSPKKEPTPPTRTFVKNYSDTLKKPTVMAQCERHEKHMERQKINKTASAKQVEVVRNHVREVEPMQKTPDQWISVSNRKKRKNKNIEDVEEVVENGLVGEEEASETVIPEPEIQPPQPPPPSPPPSEPEPKIEEPIKIEETPIIVDAKQEVTKEDKTKPSTKKKSKKNGNNNNQKSITKRVIIKDADLVQEVEKTVINKEEKPVVEEVKEVKEVKEETIKVTEVVEEEKSIQEPVIQEATPIAECVVEEGKKETPEKKSKKKKKKIPKPTVLTSSRSSSSTTLNVIDDSYDFLLETSILDQSSSEKTNVEVSQELDKMIQRGMYSSLEEKIKRLNIESSDNFFKTVIHNISRESSVENSYGNTSDLSKLLNSTSHLHLKSASNNKMELKKLGDFLAEGTPKTVVGGDEKSVENTKPDEELYPITKAVKEWMTKTRETTPDVEIFKSPSAIFREFNGAEENSFSAVDGGDEEEVTLYSNDDLLDYWEDPVPEGEAKKTSSSSSEEGEEVLEEYQSKYGTNEDYLRIKKEVEESRSGLPKHGNLPYRAICCSIM